MVINMNKKSWIIISIILILLIGGGIFFFVFKNNNLSTNKENYNNTYEANKTSTNQDNSLNQNNINEQSSADRNSDNDENKNIEQNENPQLVQPKEEQIATFSTKIYDTDSARQNNINITCNTLNGTIVKNGTMFSFCNTVGQASTSKGYQEADIFDNAGKKKKGLGGRKLSNKYYII